jgi:hypothetical protein
MFVAPFAVFATANWIHIPFEESKMRRQFAATYDGCDVIDVASWHVADVPRCRLLVGS